MANPNQAFGLRPVQNLSGAAYTGKGRLYHVASNYGTALYPGDPVIITGNGFQDPVSGEVLEEVQIATAAGSNYITGVITSIRPVTEADNVYIPASTGGYVYVETDPDILYEIQSNGSQSVNDVGATASLASGSGSAALGVSGWVLDASTVGTGSQLVIEGVRQQDRNDLTAANPVMIVRINLSQQRNTTGV